MVPSSNGILCIFVLLTSLNVIYLSAERVKETKDLLNYCLDSNHHRSEPGPEDGLHHKCQPWANRSCCTSFTTLQIHVDSMYGFDINHCSHVADMSRKCRDHFVEDLCFHECSPNVGPWVVKTDSKYRRERFLHAPLCESDCNAWYEDCAEDFTCTDNWSRNFEWKDHVNQCPVGSTCSKFKDVYRDATYFCENVWDHSWKVVKDHEPCMRLWFDPANGNPNEAVAKWKVNQMLNNGPMLRIDSVLMISCAMITISLRNLLVNH